MLWRQHRQSLVVHSPAKLNLFLDVLGKRPDGYHELETLMVSIGIYDTLSFTEGLSDRIRLRCFDAAGRSVTEESQSAGVPAGRENLVVRAAELLRKHAGVTQGIRGGLQKRIPVAAGLAGGSSNAAATLMALNRLWQLKLSRNELQQLASQLGSDVGFFLDGSSAAICRGRGERIEPLHLPLSLYFVIARPKSGLATAVVYQHCRPAKNPRNVCSLVDCLKEGRLGSAAKYFYNALQQPAEQLCPDVTRLKARFSNQPTFGHLMTGSGTAYFGVCANQRQALSVAARLSASRSGRVFVTQSGP